LALYSKRLQKKWPHLRFWEEMYALGWRTEVGYGPAIYQEDIPSAAGVYLFGLIDISFGKRLKPVRVAYVGKSRNLARRHIDHPMLRFIRRDVGLWWSIDLWFKRLDEGEITSEEIRLIQAFNPPYNIQHRLRGFHGQAI
jgi:hypothetical protein